MLAMPIAMSFFLIGELQRTLEVDFVPFTPRLTDQPLKAKANIIETHEFIWILPILAMFVEGCVRVD